MSNSIKNLDNLNKFGVEEISSEMMEYINGGDNLFYDLGIWVGSNLYRGGKAVYDGVKAILKPDHSMGIPFAA
jgi:hypothetical protein